MKVRILIFAGLGGGAGRARMGRGATGEDCDGDRDGRGPHHQGAARHRQHCGGRAR